MSKMSKPNSLADLATQVQKNADSFERSWRGEQLAKQLRDRRDQLDKINERADNIVKQRGIMLSVDTKLRVPKRKLSPAIKKLEKLEAAVKIDINKIVESDSLDIPSLFEALGEVEQSFLEVWQKFTKPSKDVSGADALANVPELEQTVQKLRTTREQLEIQGRQLPAGTKEVTSVRNLQQQMLTLTDRLLTHGLDNDVLAFLAQTRIANKGVPIAELLNKPKILKWLEAGKNASPFVVLHKSALNS
jgi:hypothetical protein